MNTEIEMQLAAMTEGQIVQLAEAKMDDLRGRVADVQQRFTAIKYNPRQRGLMAAIIDDAMTLNAELKRILAEYDRLQR